MRASCQIQLTRAVAQPRQGPDINICGPHATKLIWLALRNITAKWKNPPIQWHAAKAQFAIQFEDRFVMTRG